MQNRPVLGGNASPEIGITPRGKSRSIVDEFVQRGLIDEDKIEDFKASFKDPDEFCCLFVIDGEFTRFVYIPYPID